MNAGINSEEHAKAISNLLTTNKDISTCLTNCSNNGVCTLDSSQNFVCSCFEFYSGKMCDKDIRPCSSCPCLKNGTCINKLEISDFECKCQYPYYSRYCELKINLCQNLTCSKQGWCTVNDTTPYCKCYKGFLGENCETMSQDLQTAKLISNVSGYLAITVIVIFFGTFVCMDLSKLFMKTEKSKKKKKVNPVAEEPEKKKKITYLDYIEKRLYLIIN